MRIGGINYKLEICNNVEYDGCIDFETAIITLKSQTPDRMAKALLHESIHALCDSVGIDLPEETVISLSSVLSDCLRDITKELEGFYV
jgi:hypothetical protein